MQVVDAGCGTGILAIMAEKCGASEVLAFDNDPWCIENSEENFRLNDCRRIKALLASGIQEIDFPGSDVILANINKNIILRELHSYSEMLKPEGRLFLSGFYTEDIADLDQMASRLGLSLIRQSERENWACLVYKK
jgi:ribosomal protein L11 methyltransferase